MSVSFSIEPKRPLDIPLFGVVGWKNSGKTTLVERLVAHLSGRGYRVNTVKHAHHLASIDHPGTDSDRHRMAGASEVALVAGERWAIMCEPRTGQGPSLNQVLSRLSPADVTIVEGFKNEPLPKIEVRRIGASDQVQLALGDPHIIAVASDYACDSQGRPLFGIDRIEDIASFMINYGVFAPATNPNLQRHGPGND